MIRGCGTCRKSEALAVQLRTFWVGSRCKRRTLFLVGNVDSRDAHRIARKCAGTGGRCCVFRENMFIRRLPPHAQSVALHVTTPAIPDCLTLTMVLTINAPRFQRTHSLAGTGSSLNASNDIGMGVTDFAPICNSELVMDTVCTAVVGSERTCRVLDAGSDREDRSSDVCYVGDTRQTVIL